jgi:hypothetical protein
VKTARADDADVFEIGPDEVVSSTKHDVTY